MILKKHLPVFRDLELGGAEKFSVSSHFNFRHNYGIVSSESVDLEIAPFGQVSFVAQDHGCPDPRSQRQFGEVTGAVAFEAAEVCAI